MLFVFLAVEFFEKERERKLLLFSYLTIKSVHLNQFNWIPLVSIRCYLAAWARATFLRRLLSFMCVFFFAGQKYTCNIFTVNFINLANIKNVFLFKFAFFCSPCPLRFCFLLVLGLKLVETRPFEIRCKTKQIKQSFGIRRNHLKAPSSSSKKLGPNYNFFLFRRENEDNKINPK